MRILLPFILALVAIECCAIPRASYAVYRSTIEGRNPSDRTPPAERVFVMDNSGSIMRFHEGITLRQIVDQTSRKGKSVQILVLRESSEEAVFFQRELKPDDKPSFTVKPLDVILLEDAYAPDA
jgi:hypothetical protein